jgi:3D (Asp-Asp-Asp) domain-containing protein
MTGVRIVCALALLTVLPVVPLAVDHSIGGTSRISRTVTAPPAHAVLPITVPVASPAPARASRSTHRAPAVPSAIAARTADVPPVVAPSGQPMTHSVIPTITATSGIRHDITEYCWTGDRNAAGLWPQLADVAVLDRSIPFGTSVHIQGLGDYVVRDWIGSGSEYDIYAGRGAACEQRALAFGRQHRAVEVQ